MGTDSKQYCMKRPSTSGKGIFKGKD